MRIAIITAGTVTSFIVADTLEIAASLVTPSEVLDPETLDQPLEIGDVRQEDGTFARPVAVVTMPSLTRRQLRLALLNIGVSTADVEAHINTIQDPYEREAGLIEWQDASSYERHHPLLVEIASALELPSEQVDALWVWASKL